MKTLDDYLQYCKNRNFSEITIYNYQTLLNKINYENINIKDVVRIILSAKSANTQIAFRARFISFLKYLGRLDLVETLRELKLKKPYDAYYQTLTKQQVLEFTKIEEFDTKTTAKMKTILRFMFQTGIRLGELSKLQIKNGRMFVIDGKGSKTREIFYDNNTFTKLQSYVGWKNTPSSEIGKWCKKVFQNDNITPHSLRRSFATYLNSQGVDIAIISKQLGHENINTTYAYIHTSRESAVSIYNNFMTMD
ncbi:tyrosine recombinase XerC subunit [Mycoplasmopsis mustelae]|uniref:Tyrosine recombinase XerC subunit n=1 Tax=Mycoplasmopsis mustelae TaxID=171289 RepID=A0A4R7UCA7_9BACT|nr:tyrosine-type recombinase/integrase [Mycoplasmopsis mustelae]TDV23518.1 tyrosine recombinase XerC subunit [Mycoplasmopsis mustelae]